MARVFKKGDEYLVYNEHTTHTGTHRTVGWTTDLNKASVLCTMLPYQVRQEIGEGELIEVKVNYSVQLASEVLEPVPNLFFTNQVKVTLRFSPDQWCITGDMRVAIAHMVNHELEDYINRGEDLDKILRVMKSAIEHFEGAGVSQQTYEFLEMIVPRILKGE